MISRLIDLIVIRTLEEEIRAWDAVTVSTDGSPVG